MEMLNDLPAEPTGSVWRPSTAVAVPRRLVRRDALALGRIGWTAPLSLLFALAIRWPYFVRSDFPLGDGGMFLAMTQDLVSSHLALPQQTSYNAEAIPYAYPPLAFYVLAGLHTLLGTDLLALDRWLPLAANLASVLGVVVLARAVLPAGPARVLGPIIFALLPRSYEWLIMGGGITRSLGYLLAIACLVQAVALARAPSWRRLGVCALLAGLALAAHLEEGLFALYSAALALVCLRRDGRAVVLGAAIGLGALLLSAPWWASVVLHHGLGPFQAASHTGGWSMPATLLAAVGDFLAPASVPLGLVGSLGLLGAALCLVRGQLFLPLWLGAIFVLTPRSGPSEGVLPLALLAGLATADVVLPGLRSAASPRRTARHLRRLTWAQAPRVRQVGASLGVLALLGGAVSIGPHLQLDPHTLDNLQPDERAAMAWVADHTAPDARFLVLSSTWSWEDDQAAEWFPVLAGRQSVLTPQGAEWLPDQLHARKVCLFQKVRDLASWDRGLADLDTWASLRGVVFSDVYISRATRGPVDWSPLIAAAAAPASGYTITLDTPAAVVLHRASPIQPRWPASGAFVVAPDCQSLADQTPETQATFQASYGGRAASAWVAEHQQALAPRPSLSHLLALARTRLDDLP